MNMHQPMTELERQHQAHLARQKRFAAAVSPIKDNAALKAKIEKLQDELATLNMQLKAVNDHLLTLKLDKADLQSIVISQAERICNLEGISEQLREPDRLSVKQIIVEVLKDYPGVTYDDIVGKRRSRFFMIPRQKCMAEVYQQRPDLSLPVIGKMMKRDHTTILHAVRKLGVWRGED